MVATRSKPAIKTGPEVDRPNDWAAAPLLSRRTAGSEIMRRYGREEMIGLLPTT